MKVTAIVGSARKKHCYASTEKFLEKLSSYGDVEVEILQLSDYNLGICKGCQLCLNKGEHYCPLKDDRDIILQKIENSDGIVLATPNYSFHVSGQMKVFLDRLGFVFHRPQFFGKTFTGIVVEGVYGGNKIMKYFNFIGNLMGFNVVKASCLNTREPMPEKRKLKNERKLEKQSRQFYSQLLKKAYPRPSAIKLIMFRMARNGIRQELNDDFRDFRYYREKGWFDSQYYYPVKLNPVKAMIGNLADKVKM